MKQCIFDLGIMNYDAVIAWTVPVVFFFLVLLAGIAFNIGRKSNLIVFALAMLLPVTTGFHFYVTWRQDLYMLNRCGRPVQILSRGLQ